MKYKKIMLIALLLLAVLTIGAVSASDDVALDNVTASDDVDVIAEDDPGDDPGDGDEDEYGAFYTDEKIITDETNDNYDPEAYVASMVVPNTTSSGAFVISTDAEDDTDDPVELFRAEIIGDLENKWTIDEDTQNLVCNVYLKDLTNLTALIDGNDIYFDFIVNGEEDDDYGDMATLKVTESYFQFIDDEDEDEDEVNITIADLYPFYLPDDIDEAFASVSVPDGLKGCIVIYVEDDEEGEFRYFSSDIDNMVGDVTDDGIVYAITLELIPEDWLDDFLHEDSFTIAFLDEDEDEIASVECGIDYDEANNTVRFSELEERSGEGENLADLADIFIAEEANAANDEPIIAIPVSAVYERINDNFTVYILGDDERSVTLNISDIFDNGVYVISVSDLFDGDDLDEWESDYSFIVQFYDDEGKGNYYIETDDVTIYTNPYIYDEVNAYNDDWVIRFTEIEDADDEFEVRISKHGSEDIVKKFKVSKLINMAEDEDEDPYYVLACSDLELSEPGLYGILVNFTEDGEELIYNIELVNVTNELDIRAPEDGESFENIEDQVFIVQVDEDLGGYVKIFVNGTQVGEDIPLADLGWSMGPPGREIVLNDFNITESGNYTLKVEVYDENNTFINNATADVEVTVGENSVEFNDAYYTQDTYMIFDLRAPVDGIFVIYLNEEEAGFYDPSAHEIYWDDDFVDQWDDEGYARFLQVGNYDVNITLRDSNDVETPFAIGEFSILSMNAYADKEEYYEDDDVIISFDGEYDPSKAAKLQVVLIKSWSPMGPEDQILAEFDNDDLADMYDEDEKSFTFALNNIPAGENMIVLHYMVADDELKLYRGNYILDASDAINVTVLELMDPELSIYVDDIVEGESAVVTITTVEDFSGNVTVTIDDVDYNVTVKDGEGTISIPGLSAGIYEATASFFAEHYSLDTSSFIFEVAAKLIDPNLTIAVANIQEGNPAVVTVTTNATFSGNVTVTIANKNYTVSVVNGKGTINVPNLAAGPYTATAIFAATDIFAYSEKTTSFTVAKKPVTPAKKKDKIKLTLKKVKVKKSAKKLVLRATLKINGKAVKGKKITFKFKGKKYKAKTNKKGVAKVTIKKKVLKKLKVGKKVKYQATYGKVTKKYTVKVKR